MVPTESLASGASVALAPQNLALAAVGALLGVAVATATRREAPAVPAPPAVPAVMAVLLPLVLVLDMASALILLTAVICGGQQRAGVAARPAVASCAIGCAAALVLALAAQPLHELAQRLGPAEWAASIVFVFAAASATSSASMLRGAGVFLLGLLLAQVGADAASGAVRFSFSVAPLAAGVELTAMAVGLFALGPAIAALGAPGKASMEGALAAAPGSSAAHEAAARLSLVPLLSLGLPLTAPLALLYGAMRLQGLEPGAQLLPDHATAFWSVVASLVGMSLMVSLWSRLAHRLRMRALAHRSVWTAVVVFGTLGLAVSSGRPVTLGFAAGFSALGYAFHQLGCRPSMFLLGFVLAPSLEAHLRRALLLSDGSWSVFVTRPGSSALLAMAAVAVVAALLPPVRRWRERLLPLA